MADEYSMTDVPSKYDLFKIVRYSTKKDLEAKMEGNYDLKTPYNEARKQILRRSEEELIEEFDVDEFTMGFVAEEDPGVYVEISKEGLSATVFDSGRLESSDYLWLGELSETFANYRNKEQKGEELHDASYDVSNALLSWYSKSSVRDIDDFETDEEFSEMIEEARNIMFEYEVNHLDYRGFDMEEAADRIRGMEPSRTPKFQVSQTEKDLSMPNMMSKEWLLTVIPEDDPRRPKIEEELEKEK